MNIRTFHNKKNPYVMLNRNSLWEIATNKKFKGSDVLSASGLWSLLLSRPDDWQVRVKEISKTLKISTKETYRLLKILIEMGFCYRFQPRKKGKKGNNVADKMVYLVSEYQMDEDEFKKVQQLSHFTACSESTSCTYNKYIDNKSYSTKESRESKSSLLLQNKEGDALERPRARARPHTRVEKKEKKKEEKIIDSKVKSDKKINPLGKVWISEKKHQERLKKFGKEKTKQIYKRLDEWKTKRPEKCRGSDDRSIQRWVINAVEEDENQEREARKNEKIFTKIVEFLSETSGDKKGIISVISEDNALKIHSCSGNEHRENSIDYNEHAFKEQVESALRKWGFDFSWEKMEQRFPEYEF